MVENLFLTREQSAEIDRVAIERFGIPGIVLMENAGRNCAQSLVQSLPSDKPKQDVGFLVACGPGNNGGDGFVIARHLSIWGYRVQVMIFADKSRFTGDAKTNLDILGRASIPIESFDARWTDEEIRQRFESFHGGPTTCFVDCWLGTGAIGAPRPPLDRGIDVANGLNVLRVAIDIPTGLDCNTGEPNTPTFRADMTLTMVAQKTGFQRPSAKEFIGSVKVVEIGIPPEVVRIASS